MFRKYKRDSGIFFTSFVFTTFKPQMHSNRCLLDETMKIISLYLLCLNCVHLGIGKKKKKECVQKDSNGVLQGGVPEAPQ
jgi:hypothetical protein